MKCEWSSAGEEERLEVYRAVVEMVTNRLKKAKSV